MSLAYSAFLEAAKMSEGLVVVIRSVPLSMVVLPL